MEPSWPRKLVRTLRAARRRWCFAFLNNNWLAGRWVELTGNRGRVAGLTFDLSNPQIATFLKSRFLFRTYERGAVAMMQRHLDPGLPAIEFGACIGVVSCLTNRRLTHPERHVAVEAHPGLIPTLRANRDTNGCRFEVIHAALAYGGETVPFWLHPRFFIGSSTRAQTQGATVPVAAATLAGTLAGRDWPRISLIVDVEGAEAQLVEHEIELMARVVDTLILEIHPAAWGAGAEATARMQAALTAAGFEVIDHDGSDYVYRNRRFYPAG